MSLNLDSKKAIVANVSGQLENAQTIVLASYKGTSVEGMTKAYSSARKAKVYMHVLKNTLARRAVADTKFAPLADKMSGQLVYSISDDPVAAAKVVYDFAKDNESVQIIAGMYNEKLLDVKAVNQLASIPPREQLIAMVMGVMQQVPAGFVRALAAIRDQKQAA